MLASPSQKVAPIDYERDVRGTSGDSRGDLAMLVLWMMGRRALERKTAGSGTVILASRIVLSVRGEENHGIKEDNCSILQRNAALWIESPTADERKAGFVT